MVYYNKWVFRCQESLNSLPPVDDDDEFRFNDTSTHEGHLRQNGVLTWFYNETAITISHICIQI